MDMKLPDRVPGIADHLVYYRIKGRFFYPFGYKSYNGLEPVKLITVRGVFHHMKKALNIQGIIIFPVNTKAVFDF